MKIEKVIPNPPPEIHIILSKDEYKKLLDSAYVIKVDQTWSKEYREFFSDLYENGISV